MAKQTIKADRWYTLAQAATLVSISQRQLRRYFKHSEASKRLKSTLRRKDGTIGVKIRMVLGKDLKTWLERI